MRLLELRAGVMDKWRANLIFDFFKVMPFDMFAKFWKRTMKRNAKFGWIGLSLR